MHEKKVSMVAKKVQCNVKYAWKQSKCKKYGWKQSNVKYDYYIIYYIIWDMLI